MPRTPEAVTELSTLRSYRDFMDEAEKTYFAKVLTLSRGNKAQAARLAGMDRDTFRKRLQRYEFAIVPS